MAEGISINRVTMPERLARLIFPPKCIFCGQLLDNASPVEVCTNCMEELPYSAEGGDFKPELDVDDVYCDGIICAFDYIGMVKDAIYKFKFNDKPSSFRALGAFLAKGITNSKFNIEADIITSVPLHKKRLRERGFNQATLIAARAAQYTGIRADFSVLERVRHTSSQSQLSRAERLTNMSGAILVRKPDAIIGKTVLLVDDVLTTGNTINECCRMLKEAGALKVVAAVIASGRKFDKGI